MRQTVMVTTRGSGSRSFPKGSPVDLDARVAGQTIAEHFSGCVDVYTEPIEPQHEAPPDVVDDEVGTRSRKKKGSH